MDGIPVRQNVPDGSSNIGIGMNGLYDLHVAPGRNLQKSLAHAIDPTVEILATMPRYQDKALRRIEKAELLFKKSGKRPIAFQALLKVQQRIDNAVPSDLD